MMQQNFSTTTGLFTQNITLRRITILLLLLLGLGIRLLDLTDPPLDIHPTRQLHSALMARGMYYQGRTDVPEWQVTTAVRQWKREAVIEPPVMENLTADLYNVVRWGICLDSTNSVIFVLGGGRVGDLPFGQPIDQCGWGSHSIDLLSFPNLWGDGIPHLPTGPINGQFDLFCVVVIPALAAKT